MRSVAAIVNVDAESFTGAESDSRRSDEGGPTQHTDISFVEPNLEMDLTRTPGIGAATDGPD
eukprot:7505676-Prorocentrum_lima.AAC.1